MRAAPFLILVLLLGGCGGTPSTPQMPSATGTVAAALTIIHSPIETPTILVTPPAELSVTSTQESTPTISKPCDPATADYCIIANHFIFNRPIVSPGNDIVETTYRYGATQNGLREPHHGVEFPNAAGTPVLAAADGEVVFSGSDKSSHPSPWSNFYGNAVIIEHIYEEKPIYSLYGHLSKIDVTVGQKVGKGEKIGEVGATGAAIGNHLHFEVRQNENDYASTRNPELWLIPRPGEGALAIRVIDKYSNPLGVQINVQRVLADGTLDPVAQPEAYDTKEKFPVSSDDVYRENFTLGDLPAGTYRLTFVYHGKLFERFVELESGNLTLAEFIAN
jgi:murein DD-endopeptidase MepM/ murein hydrolase activator NlpD